VYVYAATRGRGGGVERGPRLASRRRIDGASTVDDLHAIEAKR